MHLAGYYILFIYALYELILEGCDFYKFQHFSANSSFVHPGKYCIKLVYSKTSIVAIYVRDMDFIVALRSMKS